MGLPHMLTRIRSVALLSFIVLAFAGPIPDALAQAEGTVTLRLVSQTPILTPAKPLLKITVNATNTGSSEIANLEVAVMIGANILTRTDYESSLTNGPGTPVLARAFPVNGTLAAGASRDLSVEVTPTTTSIPTLLADSKVYPMRISVRDRSTGAELGGLNSAVIEIVRKPEKPLRLGWTFEAGGAVPALDPQGRATSAIESALSPTGGLSRQVATMSGLAIAGVPFDMAVEPSLLEQLGRMTHGYKQVGGATVSAGVAGAARAAGVLSGLKTAATGRRTELTTEPFAWPSIPALLEGGLGRDLTTQNFLGRTTMSEVFGVSPDLSVTRPPGGALNDRALRALIGRSISLVLAQPDAVARPVQTNDFAPPPAATVQEGNTSATLVLPDPGTQALIDDPALTQDPVRAAQVALGELATVWKQEPVPGGTTVRGVAITLPSTLPAGFWGAFTHRVTEASFLQPVTASDLVAQVPPPGQPARLANSTPTPFRSSYVDKLRVARRDVAAMASMLPAADPQPGRLERNLLVAEASVYLADEQAGQAWISEVRSMTDSVFSSALPADNQTFTFTARSGNIPIVLGDPGSRSLNVVIKLQSSRMTFPGGSTRTVTLNRVNQVVTFAIKAAAGGPSPGVLIIAAPNGHVIGTRTIVVRSTAVNAIALAITSGAGLVLVLLWARRWFKRPTK